MGVLEHIQLPTTGTNYQGLTGRSGGSQRRLADASRLLEKRLNIARRPLNSNGRQRNELNSVAINIKRAKCLLRINGPARALCSE